MNLPAWSSTFIDIVLRSAVVYVAILIGLRVSGKREIGQLTVFDLVVLLLIANAVQNSMVGPDTSLWGGIVAALVLLGINALVARLRLSSPRLKRLVQGSPTVLVLHGEIIPAALRSEGVDEETLQAAIREHGLKDLKAVDMIVLEVDGSISVVPADTPAHYIRRPPSLLRRA